MTFEVSKSEYERFLKWRNEIDAKEEKVAVTLIKDSREGYYEDPNDEYGVICKTVSFDDDLKSMGVDSDFVENLKECGSWKEVTAAIEKEYGKCFFKLVDVYSHSGVCVNFTDLENPSKSDRWDSSLSALVFISVDEAVRKNIFGIKNENELTPEMLEEEFSNYEELVNAYLSGKGCYLASEYEIPKSTLIEGYRNNCLEKFLKDYGTQIDGPVGFNYYLESNEETNMRQINEYFGSSLIYYPDSYSGEKFICEDNSQNVEEFLGMEAQEQGRGR